MSGTLMVAIVELAKCDFAPYCFNNGDNGYS